MTAHTRVCGPPRRSKRTCQPMSRPTACPRSSAIRRRRGPRRHPAGLSDDHLARDPIHQGGGHPGGLAGPRWRDQDEGAGRRGVQHPVHHIVDRQRDHGDGTQRNRAGSEL